MTNVNRNWTLVLENDEFQLDLYARNLTRVGFSVVGALNLSQAFDALERRLFSVAIVDLMLDDPRTHGTYDGKFLMEACSVLNEGTRCIIASGQDRPGIASRLAMDYRPFEYVEKAQITNDVAVLTDAALRARDDSAVDQLGTSSAVALQIFGAAGEDSEISETNLFRALNHRGGIDSFKKSASLVLRPVLPLVPTVRLRAEWEIGPSGGSKDFWSKGLGCAVRVVVSRQAWSANDEQAEILHLGESQGTHFTVLKSERDRMDFAGTLPDRLRGRAGQ